MKYDQFRTGLTFKQIRAELRAEADAKYRAGQYMFVTRRTVLGRWHQHKRDLWRQYLKHSQD